MKKKEIVPMNVGKGFIEKVKDRYVERYADDTIKMMEDFKVIEKAYNRIKGWMDRVEDGDLTAIVEYKKERRKLENEDEYEL